MRLLKIAPSKMRAFGAREEGSVTLEAVLWFPIYAFVIAFILDVSMIFSNAAKVQRMVQDGTRAFSFGAFSTGGVPDCGKLETWLLARIQPLSPSATVSCDDTSITNMVRVQAVVKSGELDLSGATGRLGNFDMGVQIEHMIEL